MQPFKLTNAAKNDLRKIAKDTKKVWGAEKRNSYLKQLDDIFHLLAETPSVGKSCDYIKEGYLKFPQGSHIIFYKFGATSTIEVVRILHKRTNVSEHL